MSSSDSDDELPIAKMIAKQNGAAGAEPAAPAAKAKPARAPTTTEAIFDEPDSDDDLPIAQMTKQGKNGAAKAEPAEDPPAKPKPKPKTTTEAIFDEPDSDDEAPAQKPKRAKKAKAAPEDATAGDEELARRLAMGLPPRRASRGGRAPPAPSPPRRKARSPPSSDDEEDEADASDAEASGAEDAAPAEEEAPAPKKPKPKAQKGPPRGAECIGERIRVWWPADRCWYYGEVLSFDGEKHTLLYDDDEEEVVLLGEERYELSPEEAETSSSSDEESEDLSDDEYTDKIKQEVSIKYGKGASWSELFFDPSYERVEGQLEEGRYANAAPRLVPQKENGSQPAPEEDSDSDEDQSALARAAAYKAAWRDTGRAKRKVKKKTEGPFRLPFPKFGCKRHTSRKKAREAYDAQPYAFFPGDSGTTYQDFTLPLSLVVEAAIEREGEKGRREGKRSLEVALNEFELIHRSERPEELAEAAKQRFKLCRDEFGSCGCAAKVEELAAERRYWCGVLYCDSSRDDAIDAAMACPSTPSRRRAVAAIACREPLHQLRAVAAPRRKDQRTKDSDASESDEEEAKQIGCLTTGTCPARASFIECTPRTCSLGAKCGNRRLQRWKGGGIDVRDCGDARGFGLFACRNFKAGSLIGEYVGEVMRARNYAQLRRERKEKHWYFMALDKEEVVDASRRGGLTRFLNHSCEPNAECQSWTVDGEKRIAIVAQRPIATDEEVTFDYSWKGDQDKYEKRASSKTSTKCFCGAKKCRGFLGDRAEDFLASLEEEETDAGRRFFRRKLRPDQCVDPSSGKLIRSAFGEAEAEAVERTVNGWSKKCNKEPSADLQRAFSSKLFLRRNMYGTGGDPKQHQQRLLRPLEYCEVKGDGWILPALHKHGGEDFEAVVSDPSFDGPRQGRTASELERALEAWMRPASKKPVVPDDRAGRLARFEAFLALPPDQRAKVEPAATEPAWARKLLASARANPPSPKSSTPPSPLPSSPTRKKRSLSNGESPSPRKRAAVAKACAAFPPPPALT